MLEEKKKKYRLTVSNKEYIIIAHLITSMNGIDRYYIINEGAYQFCKNRNDKHYSFCVPVACTVLEEMSD